VPLRRPMATREDVAQYLGVTTKTLDDWRRAGVGPPSFRPGGRFVRYFWDDVETWVRGQPDRFDEPTGEHPGPGVACVVCQRVSHHEPWCGGPAVP
jgi:predicted DNA-binding transcriptional regulator AlpA